MANVIDPTTFLIGAAQPYYRALGVLTAWTSIGATIGDTAFRVVQSWFRPEINGLRTPIQGSDNKVTESAEITFTMVEVAGSKLALAIPGATSTVALSTDATGSPFTSTLAAAAAIGDVNVKVVAITNLVAGDYVRINVAGALAEYRRIDTVGTVGAGGTGIQFRDPLLKNHLSGVAVVETNGDGKTDITGSTVSRQPDTSYNQWAMIAQAPNGYYELLFDSGISSTDTAEISFGNASIGGIQTTIQSRGSGATPNTPPWHLRTP